MAKRIGAEEIFGLFKVTRAAVSDVSKLVHYQLRGIGQETDDNKAEPVDDAPFLQQLGVAARPKITQTLRTLGLRYGDEVWPLATWDKSSTPTDLADGETRVYAAGKIRVKISLTQDGDIKIDADGGKVIVNGGGKNVAREEDAVNVGTLSGFAGPFPVSFSYLPGQTGAPPPSTPAMPSLTGVITTGTGADKFKA